MIQNIFSVPVQILDNLPFDLESRLLLPENVAFQTTSAEFLTFSKKCNYPTEFHEGFSFSFHKNLQENKENELLTQNFLFLIESFAKKKELKLRIFQNDPLYIYLTKSCVYKPAISIFKEKNKFMIYKDEQGDTQKASLNPYLIFEIWYDEFDKTEKINNYKQIETLKQIVYAKADKSALILHTRNNKTWTETHFQNSNDVVKIMDCPIYLKDLYKNLI